MSDKTISLIILTLIVLIVIIYVIILWECYKKDVFIFAPYTPNPETVHFYPLGEITTLTPEEIATRNDNLQLYLTDEDDDDNGNKLS